MHDRVDCVQSVASEQKRRHVGKANRDHFILHQQTIINAEAKDHQHGDKNDAKEHQSRAYPSDWQISGSSGQMRNTISRLSFSR